MIFFQGLGEFVNTKFFCRVCAMLHDDVATGRVPDSPPVTYPDINEWWRGTGTCINGSWRKFKRALESASGDDEAVKPIAEGVELTLKSFLDAMKKFNIEVVDPQGEPFDPNLHQAMSMVENNEVEPNTVIAVMQKGYTLNGRLVRPAMVMVSKAAG